MGAARFSEKRPVPGETIHGIFREITGRAARAPGIGWEVWLNGGDGCLRFQQVGGAGASR